MRTVVEQNELLFIEIYPIKKIRFTKFGIDFIRV